MEKEIRNENIEEFEMQELLNQKYLFRGTNAYSLEENCDSGGNYFGRSHGGENIICTDLFIGGALVAGKNRCRDVFYRQKNAKPILMAIEVEPNKDGIQRGLEFREYEIRMPVSLKTINIIDSLEKFDEVAKDEFFDSLGEKGRYRDMFNRYYLRTSENREEMQRQ